MLIAQLNPDKAPQKSDSDREDVIDGHTHRQRLVDIFRLDGYFLQISRPRHTHGNQKLINNIAEKSSIHRRLFGKNSIRKTVAEADKNQNNGLRRQNKPLPPIIDGASQQRFEKNTDNPSDHQQRRHDMSFLFKHCYQHPRRKSQKNLFTGSIKNVQPIKKTVFLLQLQSCSRGGRPVFLHQKNQYRYYEEPRKGDNVRDFKIKIEKFEADQDGEAADNRGHIGNAAELPQSPAGFSVPGHLHTNTLICGQKQMLSDAENEEPDQHDSKVWRINTDKQYP